jgi:segregation and condensation protein B
MTYTEINLLEEEETITPTAPQETLADEIKHIIEAILFSSGEPIPLKQLKGIIGTFIPIKNKLIKESIDTLNKEYITDKRSFFIANIANGYVMKTLPQFNEYIELLHGKKRNDKISRAATEVLSIIAYKQPITRSGIDAIRGVDSSGSLHSLLDHGLIEITGRLETPGRPALYSSTNRFLEHFGLHSLKDLPSLE